jgi:hypothetical protein
VLPRSGSIVGRSMHLTRYGFALPPGGLVVPVVARGETFGEIVLVPDERYGSTHDARALAIALADQYAVALLLERALSNSQFGGFQRGAISVPSRR